MRKIMEARGALVERILEGRGRASSSCRRAAFDNAGLEGLLALLVDRVAGHPHEMTDRDIAAVRACGLSEDQIFEVVICGAVGAAIRQHDRALCALETAAQKSD
jgi:hypothetical protein